MPYCPSCGAGAEEGDRFCVSCGGSLGSVPSARAVPISEATQAAHLGPYELTGVIGRGATGTVYLASDPASGHQVALKVLDPVLAGLPGYPERLRSESDVLSQLADPHLVANYGVGQDQGHLFLVMEYVEGASLRTVEHHAGRLTPEQALGLIAGSLSGLGLAHAHGLVHGDVKPENIVIDRSGTSKLVDFGQVVSTGKTTLGGTPSYMSPEAARGSTLEARSDLYSMGVVLYEALSGTLPFSATNDLALLRMQAEDRPPPIPGLPDQVTFLIDRALAKDPADRPASAAVFLAELEVAASSAYGPDWKTRAVVAALAAGAATLIEEVASSTPAGAVPAGVPTGAPGTVKAATVHAAKGGLLASHPILAAAAVAIVVAGLVIGGVVVAKGTPGKGTTAANRQMGSSGMPPSASTVPTSWSQETVPNAESVNGVSCPTTSRCVAVGDTSVGNGGAAWVTTDGGTTWTVETVPNAGDLNGVSCVTVSDCVAVGGNNNTNTRLVGAAWVTTDGGTTWTVETVPNAEYVHSVSCATVSDCVAVGSIGTNFGTAWVTTDGGTTWSFETVPYAGLLHGVSCPTTSDCVVVGFGYGGSNTSTRFVGAAWVTTDGGTTWTVETVPNAEYVHRVSCATVSDCVAVGNDTSVGNGGAAWVTTDGGTTWTEETSLAMPVPLTVSCTTSSNCVAGGTDQPAEEGSAWSTANGGRTWTQLDLSNVGAVQSLSLPA